MKLRKHHPRPAPWLVPEGLGASAKGTPRRHYIAAVQTENAEYVLHSRKGWRRFSRRQGT